MSRYDIKLSAEDLANKRATDLLGNPELISSIHSLEDLTASRAAVNEYAYKGQRFTMDDGLNVLSALDAREAELKAMEGTRLDKDKLPDFVYRGSMANPEPKAPEPVTELELAGDGRGR